MRERILVTATKDGFFGSYRKRGDVFEVDEEAFSDFWMAKGPIAKPGRDRLEELALAARSESVAAGGSAAALTAALADLKAAEAREAALHTKLAQLEAALVERDAEIAELKGEVHGDAPPADEKPPEEAAPVTRVRRTAE